MPVPQKDWKLLRQLARRLRKSPTSIDQMESLTGQSRRTVYRWLDTLRDEGATIVRQGNRGNVRFSILGDIPDLPNLTLSDN